MTLLRTLSYAALLAFTGLATASCVSEPDYSETPEIAFKKIVVNRIIRPTGAFDTVAVTVSFKDGDGDLGLNNDEISFPYSQIDQNGQPNKYYNNYFFTPQVRNSDNTYTDLPLGNFNYNSRYPRLEPESQGSRKAPLKGELTFGQNFFQGSFAPGAVVRFKVQIVDRALHESNEIVTDPITIR
ncbi:hypothetical protein MUN84_19925 [Hymenobacter sp. 5516J-16]|uniref:hypothetical protein n=1 Tax=Hymenobacter sp. 5516J-16 TaxID=2932253 RepID=UPI001FD4CEE7|nr:hypothetical protein [Hymenobacter sp. 5516J-16]UOQ76752.1 hypothetical protein MUN84_19925 [Hymenobacter sp. 5516J-16]